MAKGLWWDTLEIRIRVEKAAKVEIYMSANMRKIVQNKWPATLSFNYSWIRTITAEFAPYHNHYRTATPTRTDYGLTPRDITIFEDVMRWLDLIDSVRDRKIFWWCALGVNSTQIAKKLKITRQTASNRTTEILRFLLKEFKEKRHLPFEYNGEEIATDSQKFNGTTTAFL